MSEYSLSFIPIATDSATHPKMLKLKKALGKEKDYPIHWHIWELWTKIGKHHPSGLLNELDPYVIAEFARWDEDDALFLKALLNERFITETEQGFEFSGWQEHAGKAYNKRETKAEANRERQRAYRERQKREAELKLQEQKNKAEIKNSNADVTHSNVTLHEVTHSKVKKSKVKKSKVTNTNTSVCDLELEPKVEILKQKENPEHRIFEHYQTYHKRVKKSVKLFKPILARLKEGYTEQELMDAIDGNHVSPHHNGANATNTEYHALDLIFRDSGYVNKFIEILEQHKKTLNVPQLNNYDKGKLGYTSKPQSLIGARNEKNLDALNESVRIFEQMNNGSENDEK